MDAIRVNIKYLATIVISPLLRTDVDRKEVHFSHLSQYKHKLGTCAPKCALTSWLKRGRSLSNVHIPASRRRTPNKVKRTRRRILSQMTLGGKTSDQMNLFRRRHGGRTAEEEAQTRFRSSSRLAEVRAKAPQSESLSSSATGDKSRAQKSDSAPRDAHSWHFHISCVDDTGIPITGVRHVVRGQIFGYYFLGLWFSTLSDIFVVTEREVRKVHWSHIKMRPPLISMSLY